MQAAHGGGRFGFHGVGDADHTRGPAIDVKRHGGFPFRREPLDFG